MTAARWLFARGDERLSVERIKGPALVVGKDDNPARTYTFEDVAALTRFQSDMEELLVHTGWTLHAFSPERRRGRDRRHFPRVTERRRWWTDPAGVLRSR